MNLLLLEPDIRLVKALSARLGAGAVVLDAARREEAEALARAGRLDAVFGEAAHLGELAAFASEGIPAGLWTSRSVDDLDAVLAPFRQAGEAIITKPEWDDPAVGRFARVHDPEGNPIELWEPPAPK